MDTKLPLFNHTIPVRLAPAEGELPSATDALYEEIHDKHVHEVQGETHYAIDLEVAAAHLVRHVANPGALDAIACVLANRGIMVNTRAMYGEDFAAYKDRLRSAAFDLGDSKDPEDVKRAQALPPIPRDDDPDEAKWAALGKALKLERIPPATKPAHILIQDHPEAFLVADGPQRKKILPLDLLAVSRIYGLHHTKKSGQPHPEMPHGGHLSAAAIKALDAFLADIGLKPNHEALRRQFCANCGARRLAPAAPDQ